MYLMITYYENVSTRYCAFGKAGEKRRWKRAENRDIEEAWKRGRGNAVAVNFPLSYNVTTDRRQA